MTLRSVVDFDLTNGFLDTTGYMLMTWKDENLFWNDSEYAEIPSLCLQDEIWSPAIVPTNTINSGEDWRSTLLVSDGTVLQFTGRRFGTFCKLDMRLYPKDSHICNFEFLSVKEDAQTLELHPTLDEVITTSLSVHGEWRIRETSVVQSVISDRIAGIHASQIVFTLVLERQPEFTVLHKSVPLFVLALAALFTHGIPLNSGERISYAVTVLLAFVFWQSVVSEELPKNSSKLSLFSISIACCMFGSGLITVLSVIFCRLATYGEERPVPSFIMAFISKRYRKKRIKNQPKVITMASEPRNKCVDYQNNDLGKEKVSANDHDTGKVDSTVQDSNYPITWAEAAHLADIFFLKVHVVVAGVIAVVYILIFVC